MKSFVILCLAFVAGPLAFAQQSSDWRPNIPEDNAAATWEQTSSLLSTLSYQAQNHPSRIDVDTSCALQAIYRSAHLGIGIEFTQAAPTGNNKIGVPILAIDQSGPADLAGMRPGDVIIGIDGHSVNNGNELVNYIHDKHVGDVIAVEYMREGITGAKSVTVGLKEDLQINKWSLQAIDVHTVTVPTAESPATVHFSGRIYRFPLPVGVRFDVSRWLSSEAQAEDLKHEQPCLANEANCRQNRQPLLESQDISFADAEIAKKYAQALANAAVLCGGKGDITAF